MVVFFYLVTGKWDCFSRQHAVMWYHCLKSYTPEVENDLSSTMSNRTYVGYNYRGLTSIRDMTQILISAPSSPDSMEQKDRNTRGIYLFSIVGFDIIMFNKVVEAPRIGVRKYAFELSDVGQRSTLDTLFDTVMYCQ